MKTASPKPDPPPPSSGAAQPGKLTRITESRFIRRLNAFRDLLVLIGVYVMFAATPFKNAELEVRHSLETIAPPLGMKAMLDSIGGTSPSDTLLFARAKAFVADTQFWKIRLANTTTSRLEDLDVQLSGVDHVEDIGVFTTSSAIREKAPSLKIVASEDLSARVTGLEQLPPRAVVELTLWGRFTAYPVPHVTSTAKSTRIRRFTSVSGIGVVIDRNREVIALTAAIILALLGLKRLAREKRSRNGTP
jgi:hypothetical protein